MLEKTPKVTVMMPVRNGGKYIRDAIECVALQSYKNIETIVCDDGSTDDTVEIVREFMALNAKLHLLENDTALGIPKTRNRILKASTGELICHLDADDLLPPHAVERMVDCFRDYPDIALAYSDRINFRSGGNKPTELASRDFRRDELVHFGWKHLGMYKTDIARDLGGFNEQLKTCSDGGLAMRIARKFPCRRVPEFLYFYRNHDANIGHTRVKCAVCPQQPVCDYYKIWSEERDIWQARRAASEKIAGQND